MRIEPRRFGGVIRRSLKTCALLRVARLERLKELRRCMCAGRETLLGSGWRLWQPCPCAATQSKQVKAVCSCRRALPKGETK